MSDRIPRERLAEVAEAVTDQLSDRGYAEASCHITHEWSFERQLDCYEVRVRIADWSWQSWVGDALLDTTTAPALVASLVVRQYDSDVMARSEKLRNNSWK